MDYKMNTIEEALEDIKNGKIVIVVDDEDRENEGDLIVPAQTCPTLATRKIITRNRMTGKVFDVYAWFRQIVKKTPRSYIRPSKIRQHSERFATGP